MADSRPDIQSILAALGKSLLWLLDTKRRKLTDLLHQRRNDPLPRLPRKLLLVLPVKPILHRRHLLSLVLHIRLLPERPITERLASGCRRLLPVVMSI